MDRAPCICPRPERNALSEETKELALTGDYQSIRGWLYAGGNINAATDKGDTLLSLAAKNGQVAVLTELLNYPSLHLNTQHTFKGGERYSPLWFAAANGHRDCVDILLQSRLACCLNLLGKRGNKMSAIVVAAEKGNWNIVNALLDSHQDLNNKEAVAVLKKAAPEAKWQLVTNIILKCSQLQADDLNPILNEAYEQGEWNMVCSILSGNFRYKYESINRILIKTVEGRNWERVAKLLEMMKEPISFDRALVNAALSEQESEVTNLLGNNSYSNEIANGILIVIAAGGTSESIANKIYGNWRSTLSLETKANAFFISSVKGHLEILQMLFDQRYFSYQTLSRAQEAAFEAGHESVNRFLLKAIDKETARMLSKIC